LKEAIFVLILPMFFVNHDELQIVPKIIQRCFFGFLFFLRPVEIINFIAS
jgi:hypothetical protein